MNEKAIKLLGGKRPKDKNSWITVSIVVALFAVIEIIKGTGHISNLLSGLLVPICMYITLAVSLNLVVGILNLDAILVTSLGILNSKSIV